MLRGLPALSACALLAATLSCNPVPWTGLPFIENDYATALATAKQRNLPIFVESWAPW